MKKAAENTTKDKHLRGKKKFPALCKEADKAVSSPDTRGKFLETADMELQYQFMAQSWGAMGITEENLKKEMEKYFNRVHAAIAGINPVNEVEAMLAVQTIAAHNMAMEFSRRAMHKQQCSEGVDVNVTRAIQFMKIFLDQVECLKKLKGKTSHQKVTVEHVHVHQGGQAIVGAVAHRGEGEEG
ncbi:MAG: hypothetical protein FJ128_13960 [Deltaproteobacteria bacterium]|nr:hypothetical protein [Deltaproteobacteria bacterium]